MKMPNPTDPNFYEYRNNAMNEMAAWILDTFTETSKYSGEIGAPMQDITGAFNNLVNMMTENFFTVFATNVWEGIRDTLLPAIVSEIGTGFFGLAATGLVKLNSAASSLEHIIEGLPILENYLYAIQSPTLRQYWNLYRQGYISQSELLAWSGAQNMLHFYKVMGADPNFVNPLKIQRQMRQIDDTQLVQSMGLDDVAQVDSLFGLGWRAAVNLNDELNTSGIATTYEETKSMIEALSADVINADSVDFNIVKEMVEKFQELDLDEYGGPICQYHGSVKIRKK
jgi:hypothetical protein